MAPGGVWQITLARSCSWICQNSANAHLKSGDFSYRDHLKSGDFSYGGQKTLPDAPGGSFVGPAGDTYT